MKVNISYTVDLDNVPSEVDRLLKDCSKLAAKTVAGLSDICAENVVTSISELKELKENLASLEISVDDCINILTGYLNVQTSLATQAMPPVEENDDK